MKILTQRSTLTTTILPLGLSAIVLLILNAGLYGLLRGNPTVPEVTFDFPYAETFDTLEQVNYRPFGGDWELKDAALVQINTVGLDLGTVIPIEIPDDQPYSYSVDIQHVGGSEGGGILFNLQNDTSRQQSHMLRFNVDAGDTYLIWGYFGDDSDFMGQGSYLVSNPDDVRRLGVQVGTDTFNITLNDAVIAPDIPLQYPHGSVGMITSASQVVFDNVEIAPWTASTTTVVENPTTPPDTTAETVTTTTASFVDAFEGDGGTSTWQPFSGEWSFINGGLRQTLTDGFDLSAGNTNTFTMPYRYRVTFRHEQGQGGGLLFNMAQSNSQTNAHMVRYVHDAPFLTWGYFDDNGVYQGQGSVEVPAPAQNIHTLEVVVNPTAYDIILDNVPVATAIPVMQTGEHIGLTSAQSVTHFEQVEVYGNTETVAVDTVETSGFGIEAATGNWDVTGDVITQLATDPTDYILGTGFAAETFRLNVDISMNDNTGGGIVFHMAGRDDPANGHMVRFDTQNQQMFWGQYNAERLFTGNGSAPIDIPTDTPQTLAIIVRADTYDVLVNDVQVVGDIPITGDAGWIGLVSFGGSVTFEGLQLSREGES